MTLDMESVTGQDGYSVGGSSGAVPTLNPLCVAGLHTSLSLVALCGHSTSCWSSFCSADDTGWRHMHSTRDTQTQGHMLCPLCLCSNLKKGRDRRPLRVRGTRRTINLATSDQEMGKCKFRIHLEILVTQHHYHKH